VHLLVDRLLQNVGIKEDHLDENINYWG
jgi:hypothetical protein